MIVEMRKCNLVALSKERDGILNALHRSNAAEIKTQTEEADTFPLVDEGGGLREYHDRLEGALALLFARADSYRKEHKTGTSLQKDGFSVSYSEFMAAGEKKEFCDRLTEDVLRLEGETVALQGEIAKAERALLSAYPYSRIREPFDGFSDGARVCVRLGALSARRRADLEEGAGDLALAAYAFLPAPAGEELPLCVISHRTAAQETDALLSSAGFVPCPFAGGETGEELYLRLQRERDALAARRKEAERELFSLSVHIRTLKIYCDYVAFLEEKAECADKLRGTERTFLLEAYVPAAAEKEIEAELTAASSAVYWEFSDCSEEEVPPTLLKNGKVVENFESLTNTYSAPNYREFDPNAIMSVFYSIFLGFIVADIAYGVIMFVAGIILRKLVPGRKGGMGSLAAVFACGGVFAVVWGFLFNSLFGVKLPIPTLLPDAQSDMWGIAGINVPAVFVISLIIGVVHLGAGYVCLLVQCWRRREYARGVFQGGTWAGFSVGVVFAIVGFVDEFDLRPLAYAGGIVAVVCLAAAVLTAGYRCKFTAKLAKGFTSLYGVINYMSDVLSYARLYGLMLSGAVIAQIVSQYAIGFITGGNAILVLLGVVLMLAGHAFNIAISLLGAYIHDARLQYVEFYGKFFEGEGELFRPLGSSKTHVGELSRPARDAA